MSIRRRQMDRPVLKQGWSILGATDKDCFPPLPFPQDPQGCPLRGPSGPHLKAPQPNFHLDSTVHLLSKGFSHLATFSSNRSQHKRHRNCHLKTPELGTCDSS